MQFCTWNTLSNGRVHCPYCDPHKRRSQSRKSTRNCRSNAERPGQQPQTGYEPPDFPNQIVGEGPGTELKKLLGRIGIVATPNCKCTQRATRMDEMGIAWCEKNLELITDWLEEEAAKRRKPFLRIAGKTLIRLAIKRAKRKKSKDEKNKG